MQLFSYRCSLERCTLGGLGCDQPMGVTSCKVCDPHRVGITEEGVMEAVEKICLRRVRPVRWEADAGG